MRFYALAACVALLASIVTSARVTPAQLLLPHPLPAARQLTSQHLANRVPPEFNINSGGPAVGRFVAENPAWIVGTTSSFASDTFVIGGAEPKNLPMYRSHRFGVDAATWGYDIPVSDPGVYGCTAHFAETDSASFVDGRRVFDLYFATAHGDPVVFPAIDIVDQLGGAQFTVLTKTAPALVVTGILSVRVVSAVGNPIISGLTCERTADLPPELQPDFETQPALPADAVAAAAAAAAVTAAPSPATPSLLPPAPDAQINVNCGGPELGRFVEEDHTWIRGTTSFWGGPPGVLIGGADPENAPAIISHRYGLDGSPWGYTIPVSSPGIYACSLHFAETDTSSFSIGARVFDVNVMGNLIEDVDVFAETGQAEFTALVKTFTDLTVTDAIQIDLIPKVGDAFIAAITCEQTQRIAAAVPPQASSTPQASSPSSASTDVGPQPAASPSGMGRETILPEEAVSPETVETETPTIDTPETLTPEVLVPESNQTVLVPTGSDDASSTESPAELTPVPDEPSPAADGAAPAATVTPTPSASTVPDGAASVSPAPQASVQSTPVGAEPSMAGLEPSPEASVDTAAVASASSSPSASASADDADSLEQLSEEPLVNRSGEFLITFNLRVLIGEGGVMTRELRDVLKRVSSDAAAGSRNWAAIGIRELDASSRQATADTEYAVDMQASYGSDQDEEESKSDYRRFVESEEMNRKLEEAGVNNVRVSLNDGAVAAENFNETVSVSNTSTIVGVVVGCVLGAMVLVAVLMFYVLRRNRSNSDDDFNAPPPTMTESEMSSVVERTETAASIEYLDDDSTFTAATSRAGDQADQMAYVKDAFGRGTEGAHGSMSA